MTLRIETGRNHKQTEHTDTQYNYNKIETIPKVPKSRFQVPPGVLKALNDQRFFCYILVIYFRYFNIRRVLVENNIINPLTSLL